ncbi:MAG: DUF1501 domain-containing protein [Pirellulaceae bacterium]|nr:DUF1501 domain-containing protein [Pirellulaceae bacterium]
MSNYPWSRRSFLQSNACGFGYLAFAGLAKSATADYQSPLMPKSPHHTPRAKRIIFLYMRGGPAQQDLFDYKPELNAADGKASKNKGRNLIGSKYKFERRGDSGLWISELLPNIATHADDLCVLNGMHTDIPNHPEATVQLHTGSAQFVRPSVGAWTLYGLGTENQNLPGFVTISPPVINGGSENYGTAFLPAVYQGTAVGNLQTPVKDAKIGNISNPVYSRLTQRMQIDLIQEMNKRAQGQSHEQSQIDAMIESYELAFRMQNDLPKVLDLADETAETLEMYGIGEKSTDDFGRQCLMARRLAESGVRYIELAHQFWDQHKNLDKDLRDNCRETDKPISGLLTDLKQRGLLNDTLIVWSGEFGRTSDSPNKDGRDHNAKGYTAWMAGGGVKAGLTYGATDELGHESVDGRVHLHDMHATMLHVLGLDHTQLTYRYAGRDFRLTDVHGRVVDEILA